MGLRATLTENRLEAELHAIEVCYQLASKAILERIPTGRVPPVRVLLAIGLSRIETEVRTSILAKVGGPIPPVMLIEFAVILSNLVNSAHYVEHVGNMVPPPSKGEIEAAQQSYRSDERRLQEAVNKVLRRQSAILSQLLPACRRRIESGFRDPQD
ncbi:hypothetical protein ABID58_006363 [Bradyrhizobium sp. S3.2.6]|uniref:hypothetical protein n=1 Tax=Bradyrhizobium sp. S3.2.6 TaxID=3156428 RepID=UPI00339647C2